MQPLIGVVDPMVAGTLRTVPNGSGGSAPDSRNPFPGYLCKPLQKRKLLAFTHLYTASIHHRNTAPNARHASPQRLVIVGRHSGIEVSR